VTDYKKNIGGPEKGGIKAISGKRALSSEGNVNIRETGKKEVLLWGTGSWEEKND